MGWGCVCCGKYCGYNCVYGRGSGGEISLEKLIGIKSGLIGRSLLFNSSE